MTRKIPRTAEKRESRLARRRERRSEGNQVRGFCYHKYLLVVETRQAEIDAIRVTQTLLNEASIIVHYRDSRGQTSTPTTNSRNWPNIIKCSLQRLQRPHRHAWNNTGRGIQPLFEQSAVQSKMLRRC